MDDKIAARELFRYYRGSRFLMWRDEKVELYKSYKATAEEERGWMREIQKEFLQLILTSSDLGKVEVNVMEVSATLEDGWGFPDAEFFPTLVDAIRTKSAHMDSWQNVVAAESLLDAIKAVQKQGVRKEAYADGMDLVGEVLNGVLSSPISFTTLPNFAPPGVSAEQHMIDRAQRDLKKWKEFAVANNLRNT